MPEPHEIGRKETAERTAENPQLARDGVLHSAHGQQTMLAMSLIPLGKPGVEAARAAIAGTAEHWLATMRRELPRYYDAVVQARQDIPQGVSKPTYRQNIELMLTKLKDEFKVYKDTPELNKDAFRIFNVVDQMYTDVTTKHIPLAKDAQTLQALRSIEALLKPILDTLNMGRPRHPQEANQNPSDPNSVDHRISIATRVGLSVVSGGMFIFSSAISWLGGKEVANPKAAALYFTLFAGSALGHRLSSFFGIPGSTALYRALLENQFLGDPTSSFSKMATKYSTYGTDWADFFQKYLKNKGKLSGPMNDKHIFTKQDITTIMNMSPAQGVKSKLEEMLKTQNSAGVYGEDLRQLLAPLAGISNADSQKVLLEVVSSGANPTAVRELIEQAQKSQTQVA